MATDSTDREIDAVEFVVIDRATVYIVTNGEVQEEGLDLPGVLDRVTVYAEGEWVREYLRGDDIDDQDTAFVVEAAKLANIALAGWGRLVRGAERQLTRFSVRQRLRRHHEGCSTGRRRVWLDPDLDARLCLGGRPRLNRNGC